MSAAALAAQRAPGAKKYHNTALLVTRALGPGPLRAQHLPVQQVPARGVGVAVPASRCRRAWLPTERARRTEPKVLIAASLVERRAAR